MRSRRRRKIIHSRHLGPATRQDPDSWLAPTIESACAAPTSCASTSRTVSARRTPSASQMVREVAEQVGKWVAVLGDLQGPKIRIERFAQGKVHADRRRCLRAGRVARSAARARPLAVGVAYKNLPNDVRAGDTLLLNDGQIVLDVTGVDGPRIDTRVVRRRRAVGQQGHQQAGRRPLRRRADRQGPRRHPPRRRARRRLSRRLVRARRQRHGRSARAAAPRGRARATWSPRSSAAKRWSISIASSRRAMR